MKTILEETYVDKKDWPRGQWDDEPDKIHFVDEETDMDCLVVRGPSGALCGYVAVPPGHPAHGADYQELPIDVHGGLTYASLCDERGKICHVPRPGHPHNVFWLGFDCANLYDLCPKHGFGDVYRTLSYVLSEIQSLARQLKLQTQNANTQSIPT